VNPTPKTERTKLLPDGNAAYRIALYYEGTRDDKEQWLFWVREAARLANPNRVILANKMEGAEAR
jgi:hypothetical protein